MFKAKQVQTLDVDKIMEMILENHDAKVAVDKLAGYLDKQLENNLAEKNNDADIKDDAKKGYGWRYRDVFEGITISGEMLAEIIGYKVKSEDQGTFHIIQDKYNQFRQDVEQKKGDE